MASMGSLLGGLQSAKNPGVNMTPGAVTPRPSRLGVPLLQSRLVKPVSYTGVPLSLGGLRGSTVGLQHLTNPATVPVGGGHAITPGGSRPTMPTLPGRGTTPPGPAAPAGPSLLSFDQWLASQPLWIQQQANDVNTTNSLMAGYGFYKDAEGKFHDDPAANPDSVIAQEDLRRQQGIGRTAQQGANHGNLFSGASLIGVQNANDAYRQGAAKALRELEGKIGDITQHELDTKIGMGTDYTDYVGNTKAAQATAAAAVKPPVTGATARAPMTAAEKEADRQRRIKKAQDHLKADKAKAAKTRKRRAASAVRAGAGLGVNQGGGSIARGA